MAQGDNKIGHERNGLNFIPLSEDMPIPELPTIGTGSDLARGIASLTLGNPGSCMGLNPPRHFPMSSPLNPYGPFPGETGVCLGLGSPFDGFPNPNMGGHRPVPGPGLAGVHREMTLPTPWGTRELNLSSLMNNFPDGEVTREEFHRAMDSIIPFQVEPKEVPGEEQTEPAAALASDLHEDMSESDGELSDSEESLTDVRASRPKAIAVRRTNRRKKTPIPPTAQNRGKSSKGRRSNSRR